MMPAFNSPLFCFEAYNVRDCVLRNLKYAESPEEPRFLHDQLRIDKWIPEDTGISLYVTTIRRDSIRAYINDLETLKDTFPVIFVYHESLTPLHLSSLGSKFTLNAPIQDIERVCNVILTDRQRAEHARIISHQEARPPSMGLMFIQRLREMDLDVIFQPEEDDDDAHLNLALRLSEEEAARQQEARSRVRTALQEGWEDVLKKSEPKKKGYPVCICCKSAMATICMVECGHLALCDDCVRVIWTRSTLARACVVCRKECTMITRVVWTELADSDDEEEEEEKPRNAKRAKN